MRNDAAGAEVVAAVAKLPEGERAGYMTYAIQAKLTAAGAPKVPTHTVVKSDADEKPKRRDVYADAYKSTFPGAAQGASK